MADRYRDKNLYGVIHSRPCEAGDMFANRNLIKRIPLPMGALRPRMRFMRDKPYHYKFGGIVKPWARKYERED